MSYSLWPHGLQHARHPCPILTPGVCSISCSLATVYLKCVNFYCRANWSSLHMCMHIYMYVLYFIFSIVFYHKILSIVLFAIQYVCSVAHSCPTLCNPMDCSPPGSSVHWILQVRILEWVAMPSSRVSSQPRGWTQVSHIAGGFFTIWASSYTLGPWLSVHFILGMHVIGSLCPTSSQVFLKATLVSLPAFRKLDEHRAECSEMPCLQTLWAPRWVILEAR